MWPIRHMVSIVDGKMSYNLLCEICIMISDRLCDLPTFTMQCRCGKMLDPYPFVNVKTPIIWGGWEGWIWKMGE